MSLFTNEYAISTLMYRKFLVNNLMYEQIQWKNFQFFKIITIYYSCCRLIFAILSRNDLGIDALNMDVIHKFTERRKKMWQDLKKKSGTKESLINSSFRQTTESLKFYTWILYLHKCFSCWITVTISFSLKILYLKQLYNERC